MKITSAVIPAIRFAPVLCVLFMLRYNAPPAEFYSYILLNRFFKVQFESKSV